VIIEATYSIHQVIKNRKSATGHQPKRQVNRYSRQMNS